MKPVYVALLLAGALPAQWVKQPAAGVPRLRGGSPNLSAPTPRLNGKPDLNGLWQTDESAPGEIEKMLPGIGINAVPGDDPTTFPKYFFDLTADYKPGELVMSPEAARLQQQTFAQGEGNTNSIKCLPAGPPMTDIFPSPRRFVQTPAILAILYEGDPPRQIHTDGRKLPVDPQPAWEGYSIGRWDGDTLVVETVGVQERAPLDGMGHPRSSESKITERIRRRDYGHMEVQVRIEDPQYYSRPIELRYTATLVPDDDLLEWICLENEVDREHIR